VPPGKARRRRVSAVILGRGATTPGGAGRRKMRATGSGIGSTACRPTTCTCWPRREAAVCWRGGCRAWRCVLRGRSTGCGAAWGACSPTATTTTSCARRARCGRPCATCCATRARTGAGCGATRRTRARRVRGSTAGATLRPRGATRGRPPGRARGSCEEAGAATASCAWRRCRTARARPPFDAPRPAPPRPSPSAPPQPARVPRVTPPGRGDGPEAGGPGWGCRAARSAGGGAT